MKKFLLFVSAVFCLAFALNANAFDESHIKAWDNVYLVDSMQVPVKIKNTSLTEKTLEVEFFAPEGSLYRLSGVPEKIGPMETAEFTLELFPTIDLEGTTYNSSLMVTLGGETAIKEIKLHSSKYFPEQEEQPAQEENKNGTGIFPMAVLGGIEGFALSILLAVVIILGIAIVGKLLSMKGRQEREFYG